MMVTIIIIIFNPALLSMHFKNEKPEAQESLSNLFKDVEPVKSRPGIWAQLYMTLSTL